MRFAFSYILSVTEPAWFVARRLLSDARVRDQLDGEGGSGVGGSAAGVAVVVETQEEGPRRYR